MPQPVGPIDYLNANPSTTLAEFKRLFPQSNDFNPTDVYNTWRSTYRGGGGGGGGSASSPYSSSGSGVGGNNIFGSGGGSNSFFGNLVSGLLNSIPAARFVTSPFTSVSQTFDAFMGQRSELEGRMMPPSPAFLTAIGAARGLGFDEDAATKMAAIDPYQLLDQLKQESELRNEINQQTSLTGELSEGLRSSIEKSTVYAAKYGFTMKDLGDLYIGLVEESGKFALINKETMDSAIPATRMLGMTMDQMSKTIAEFEKVGIGARETVSSMTDAGLRSISLGLSAKKITDDMKTNIGKLNEYGFQNGIKGLERMVQRANEFRLNMEAATKIADDVMDPDKALALTANLQVLGGAIGDFNDPLKLMYMATNNVEGLQDALIGAASSLATYNSEQGRFEITGVNLRRAKEMAGQLGMSLGELNKTAIAAAERSQAASALLANNIKVDDEQMEFLTNLSRMEGGEMKITIPENVANLLGGSLKGQTTIALSQLDQKNAELLLSQQDKLKDKTVEQIANDQLTELQQMSRNLEVVGAYYKLQMSKLLVEPTTNYLKTLLGEKLGFTNFKDTSDELLRQVGTFLGGESTKATQVPVGSTSNESTTTSSTSTQTINYNATFRSDPDSDRARRLWEEEMARNPRDFTNWR